MENPGPGPIRLVLEDCLENRLAQVAVEAAGQRTLLVPGGLHPPSLPEESLFVLGLAPGPDGPPPRAIVSIAPDGELPRHMGRLPNGSSKGPRLRAFWISKPEPLPLERVRRSRP